MMWPSAQASKLLTLLLMLIIIYCIYMDTLLFLRIQNYRIDTFDITAGNTTRDASTHIYVKPQENYEDATWIPCSVNPICHPTVKGLMVDHINHYIYGPLCAMFDIALGVSDHMLFITPNMISLFHVLVAGVGAKLLTCQNLAARRLAIVLFQLRMFLDDLDGHVARQRKHIKGERSEVGTVGYWVDGVCDSLGVVAMITGIAVYLRNNPPRRGYRGTPVSTLPYHQLKEINTRDDMEKENKTEIGVSYKTKVTFQRIVQALGLFSGQMLLSSIAWNRYIDLYQDMLENCSSCDPLNRVTAFRSGVCYLATGLWRILNPHSYLHLLSLAVFCDRTWCFLRAVHCSGYIFLGLSVVTSEYLVDCVRSLVS